MFNLNTIQKILCISVLFVVFSVTNVHTLAFAEISLFSYDSTVSPTDKLLIMGTIDGDIQSFHPIKLVIYDPSGNVVYQPNVAIDGDGKFKYLITPPIPRFDEGQYTVEASQENLEEKTRIYFMVSNDMSNGVFDEDMEAEIVPEFGTIAMMILVVSIVSIIGISAKNKMMFKSFTSS
ncbi:PEFG-CTERM sorting domain-containing protein [Nitrosopumilus sp. K4]|nr:PEFG-CTERM sorting domain-containing protein [Nitrosopumilus sp. K4]